MMDADAKAMVATALGSGVALGVVLGFVGTSFVLAGAEEWEATPPCVADGQFRNVVPWGRLEERVRELRALGWGNVTFQPHGGDYALVFASCSWAGA